MADFKTQLVKQSVLSDITDELDYAVYSGGASNTYQQFNAISSSASSITFNVQVPSESVVLDRELFIQTDINFNIRITNVPVGSEALQWTIDSGFQAFPFSHLITTASAQINNTNVSVNLQDVLPQLLRMMDDKELGKYAGMCPFVPDKLYKEYGDASNTSSNPLSGPRTAGLDGELYGRGSQELISYVVQRHEAGADAVADADLTSANLTDYWDILCTVRLTEPVMLSPFLWGPGEFNRAGMVGINGLSIVLNIDSTCKRFLSFSKQVDGVDRDVVVSLTNSVNTNAFENTMLLVNFISSQPSDLISVRNVLPYMDFPRYTTYGASTMTAGATSDLNSQNIQLNQLPDYFIICVRKQLSSQDCTDSDSFLQINSVSVNMNNASGLLSGATQADLWRLSVKNGSRQSYLEFRGTSAYEGAGDELQTAFNTTGSLLVLNPAYNLSLPDYLSNGSVGQYNFQIKMNITNNSSEEITPEIVIVCANSGVFSTIQGSSSIFTGILNKAMVLDAKSQEEEAMSSEKHRRLVGGRFCDGIASGAKKMREGMRYIMEGKGVVSGGAMDKLDALCG